MPGPTRSRRAPTGASNRLDKKLEEDELFKEIGGQLDAGKFDYSEWQRTSSSKSQTPTSTRPPFSFAAADPKGLNKAGPQLDRPSAGTRL